jgi:hypothetical protein
VTQSGLALQLDDWHRVTLTLRMEGQDQGHQNNAPTVAPMVALCATVVEQAPWCRVAPQPAHDAAPTHGIFLRVTQSGATLTGLMSLDGTLWTTVGVWTVAWRPTADAQLGAWAPPTAEITAAGSTAPALLGASTWPCYTSVALFDASPMPQTDQTPVQFSAFSVTSGTESAAPVSGFS